MRAPYSAVTEFSEEKKRYVATHMTVIATAGWTCLLAVSIGLPPLASPIAGAVGAFMGLQAASKLY